jgi:hypothetical protein
VRKSTTHFEQIRIALLKRRRSSRAAKQSSGSSPRTASDSLSIPKAIRGARSRAAGKKADSGS